MLGTHIGESVLFFVVGTSMDKVSLASYKNASTSTGLTSRCKGNNRIIEVTVMKGGGRVKMAAGLLLY